MDTVYFIDLRATYKENFLRKLDRLLQAAGLADVVRKRDLVAVKLHFGEPGNTAFIRPVLVRQVVDAVCACGGTPFLTDANTLYAGSRGDAPHHLDAAVRNGFAFSVVGAPLVIADGLRGRSETPVAVKGKHFKRVFIGSEIVAADALVSVAHFKGHELAGFGGTLKNIGMGCASRKGKLAQHSDLGPRVKGKRCVGCGECILRCSRKALCLVEGRAKIDPEKCIGCGECILICPNGAIQVRWNQSVPLFMEKMAEYARGVLKGKGEKSLFLNFITHVSPACDCVPANDAPIVRDIGVLASRDPVAIDQAAADLVNGEPALPGCCLTKNTGPGEDKFRGIYPEVDWTHQLTYAESLGLGSREYRLEKI